MDDLRICAVQADLVWENKTKNLELLYALVKDIEDTDVIVLPEMFATGFTMNAKEFASTASGVEVVWMQKLAAEKNSCVVGSLIISEDDKFYNRLFWVMPNGVIWTYNKRHLFSLAGEEKVFTAGNEQLIVEYKSWRIMPLVCYDLRFPVWSRNNVNYDLLLYVANWPERRKSHWQQLLPARAIENQSYVVGVNRVGNDGNGIAHSGNTVVLDPLGEMISSIPESTPCAQIVTLSRKNLLDVRRKFSFLADQDEFEIHTSH
jgi:predicted amidohydrolase